MQQNKVYIDGENMKQFYNTLGNLKQKKQPMVNIETFETQKYYLASKLLKNAINLVGGSDVELQNIYKKYSNLCSKNLYHKIDANISCNFTNNGVLLGGSIIGINKNKDLVIQTDGGNFSSNLIHLVKDNNSMNGGGIVNSSDNNTTSTTITPKKVSSNTTSDSNKSSSTITPKKVSSNTTSDSSNKSSTITPKKVSSNTTSDSNTTEKHKKSALIQKSSSNKKSSSSSSSMSSPTSSSSSSSTTDKSSKKGGSKKSINKKGGNSKQDLQDLLLTSSIDSSVCY